jgi:myosin heavy subunit
MEPEKKEESKNKVLYAIIVVLLIGLSFSLYYNYTGNKENVDLTSEKAQLQSEFSSLSDTMDVRNSEILLITDKNTALDSAVTVAQAQLEEDRKKIKGMLSKSNMTKAELKEAKQKIKDYEASVTDLQAKITELTAQNQQLTEANKKLGEDLVAERKTTTELNERNIGLSKTVEVGQLLQLTMLEVEGVKQRPNGRDRAVKNAKAAESIKISFETGENKILPAGTVSLYVRVINPKGETISVENQGSGLMTLAGSDLKIQYSTKADIDWNQANKKVSVYWKQFISTPGTYKVEIYQSGYLTGKGEVTLN